MEGYQLDEDGYVIVEFVYEPSYPMPVIARQNLSGRSWLDTLSLPDHLLPSYEKFMEMWNLHPAKHHEIMMYGKKVPIPRFQQAYLRDYTFSGSESMSLPLPEIFQPYLDWMNSLQYGEFNQFLMNWYQDGDNYIGSHSDDENQLIPHSPIVSITLCIGGHFQEDGNFVRSKKETPRKFRIRDKQTKEIVQDVLTPNGVILVMGGYFQTEYKHEIVKISGKAAKTTGPRISVTLRQFK